MKGAHFIDFCPERIQKAKIKPKINLGGRVLRYLNLRLHQQACINHVPSMDAAMFFNVTLLVR